MKGTRIPAGNLLLSFATLVAGASASKIFRVFSHVGMFVFDYLLEASEGKKLSILHLNFNCIIIYIMLKYSYSYV